jgi:predicted transcriptional regulator
MAGARNADYTDQEVLHILDDVADDKGWASSEEIAQKMGIPTNKNKNGQKTSPAQNVGVRLGWMKRFGFVMNEGGMWKVTARGARFMDAKLTPSQKAMLEAVKKEDSLEVMNVLGRRFLGANRDEMTRTALRREFQHYTHTGQRVRSRRK